MWTGQDPFTLAEWQMSNETFQTPRKVFGKFQVASCATSLKPLTSIDLKMIATAAGSPANFRLPNQVPFTMANRMQDRMENKDVK